MPRVVGIDLGTTNSLVAFMEGGRPRVIADVEGRALLPSVVHSSRDEGTRVGYEAQARLVSEPHNVVYSVKRFMGKGREDIKEDLKLLPFDVVDRQGVIRIRLDEREWTPPELSALILRELKQRAEKYFGESIEQAVVTVPAYFNDSQRQATRDAGRIAGLDVLRIVNEPTAAALAYGIDKRQEATVAVYDFGGGTFDVSILKLKDGIFEVRSTNGDTHLGGDDLDNALLEMALAEIRSQIGLDLRADHAAVQLLRQSVIEAKITLSDRDSGLISWTSADQTKRYRREMTRAEFEGRIAATIERTIEPCRRALEDAGLKAADIDEVILVGGSTRIPLVRKRVEETFGRKPHIELNPDEVVALGAAVQADILAGGVTDMLLLDVIPLSLGIETMGGVVSKLIHRNSTIPASAVEQFTTFADSQTGVEIHVVQGERELVQDCRSLGKFTLKGIPPMPAGLPKVEVRFQVDANGILGVTARELRTGRESSIEVKPSYGLTDEEVERMLLESFEFAEQDIERRLAVEAKVEAEKVLMALDKIMRQEVYQRLDSAERTRIVEAIRQLRGVMGTPDHRVIQEKVEALNQVAHHLAEEVMNSAVRSALTSRNVEEV